VNQSKITKRYIFLIEHICKPDEVHADITHCYGWVSCKASGETKDTKKAYASLEQLPEIIHQLISLTDDQAQDNNK